MSEVDESKENMKKEVLDEIIEWAKYTDSVEYKKMRKLSLEEKIEAMIEWNKYYPMMRLDKVYDLLPGYKRNSYYNYDMCNVRNNESFLKFDAEPGWEYYSHYYSDYSRYARIRTILESFNKIKEYYGEVKRCKKNGELTEEQISRCKEGNVRGVFGYPKSTEKIAADYNFDIDKIDEIITKYGTIENYLIQENLGWKDCRRDFFEENLNNDKGIENLIFAVQGFKGRTIYNKDVILEKINKIVDSEKQRKALTEYYGLNGQEEKKLKEIGAEMGISEGYAQQHISKAIQLLKTRKNELDIKYIPDFRDIEQEDSIKIVKALGNYALGNSDKYNIENLNELVYDCKLIENYGTTMIPDEEKEKRDTELQIKELKKQVEPKNVSIDQLDLPIRTRNRLHKAGIHTVQEMIDFDAYRSKYDTGGIERLGGLGNDKFAEVKRVIKIYKEAQEDKLDEIEDSQKDLSEEREITPREKVLKTSIEELNISNRGLNVLKKMNVSTLKDLLDIDKDHLRGRRGMGQTSFDEIILKLSEKGLEYNQDGKLAFKDIQEQEEMSNEPVNEQTDLSVKANESIDIDEEKKKELHSEVKVISENTETSEVKKEKTELELLKEERDRLLVKQRMIQEKLAQAKELSASYDRLNGDSKDKENIDLDDE